MRTDLIPMPEVTTADALTFKLVNLGSSTYRFEASNQTHALLRLHDRNSWGVAYRTEDGTSICGQKTGDEDFHPTMRTAKRKARDKLTQNWMVSLSGHKVIS